jgi:hypothetical protein
MLSGAEASLPLRVNLMLSMWRIKPGTGGEVEASLPLANS